RAFMRLLAATDGMERTTAGPRRQRGPVIWACNSTSRARPGAAGTRLIRPYQYHANTPITVSEDEPSASDNMVDDSSGDNTPATTLLSSRLANACTEEIPPRKWGNRSSSSKVSVGNASCTP